MDVTALLGNPNYISYSLNNRVGKDIKVVYVFVDNSSLSEVGQGTSHRGASWQCHMAGHPRGSEDSLTL